MSYYNSQYSYFYCRYCKLQGYSVSSCRSDKIEKAIYQVLSGHFELSSQSRPDTEILRDIEHLKSRKRDAFQDYKDYHISREEYLNKKIAVDQQVAHLEKMLLAEQKPQLSTKELTEILLKHM
ncbi:hypothetical protein NX86_08245 [Streptococcus phocae subsp. salmonis]|uniref:hypothetical protein n=1 Tax=Streptococcus phocae TaxID=119224 RepID=UPI00053163F0|nr:hypothetical protein [Streptococcus phocae]KGR72096.1 hypothetical protein NX86_08245 [Streptococcus phocae subsp. salmonis]